MTPTTTTPKRKRTPYVPLQNRSFPPEIPGTAWLKLPDVLEYVPVSRSQWFRGIESGQFPAPHKVGRLSFWKARDIRALLNTGPKRARRRNPSPARQAQAA